MSTFPAAFREIVTPVLHKMARFQGLYLALGRTSFTEAYDAVFDIARDRGAMFLPDHFLDALRDWIAQELLKAYNEFEPSVEERRQIANRVAADIARCEAAWTTT